MANKRYDEFDPISPDPLKIFLLADPDTGELGKITYGDIAVTGDNGLSASTNKNVQLGGPVGSPSDLTNDRWIDANGFSLYVVDNAGTSPQLLYVSGGTTTAIQASGSQGITSFGSSVGAGMTSPSLPLWVIASNSSLNTVQQAVLIDRNPFGGTPANGIGASVDFNVVTATSADISNRVISKWIDATHATRTSKLEVSGVDSGTTKTLLEITGAGIFTLTQGLQDFADDTAASGGGIPINGLYRTGSAVKIRVT